EAGRSDRGGEQRLVRHRVPQEVGEAAGHLVPGDGPDLARLLSGRRLDELIEEVRRLKDAGEEPLDAGGEVLPLEAGVEQARQLLALAGREGMAERAHPEVIDDLLLAVRRGGGAG